VEDGTGAVAQLAESVDAWVAGSSPARPCPSSSAESLPDCDTVNARGVLICGKVLAWAKGREAARLITRVDRYGRTWIEKEEP